MTLQADTPLVGDHSIYEGGASGQRSLFRPSWSAWAKPSRLIYGLHGTHGRHPIGHRGTVPVLSGVSGDLLVVVTGLSFGTKMSDAERAMAPCGAVSAWQKQCSQGDIGLAGTVCR